METDIVPTLFGVTTDSYRQAQQDRADAQAMKFAQLDPFQQANYSIGRGAYGLAGALGGALGGQDPELQRISMRQQIAGQIDYGDPQSLLAGGRELARRGDIVGAMQAADIARKLESEMAQRYQRQSAGEASLAEAAKNRQETNAAINQQNIYDRIYPAAPAPAPVALSTTDPDTGAVVTRVPPQSAAMSTAMPPVGGAAPAVPVPAQTRAAITQQIADLRKREGVLLGLTKIPGAVAQAKMIGEDIKVLQASIAPTNLARLEGELARLRAEGVLETDPQILDRLSEIDKLVSIGGDQDRNAIAKEQFGKRFDRLTPEQAAAVNAIVQANKKDTAPRTTVNIKGEEAFATGRGKSQSDQLNDAATAARTATQALAGLSSMKQLNASGELFTGPLANPHLAAANLLASVGLLSPNQVGRLAKSEIYDKQAKDLVMQDLGGKLGAQISDADRKFVEARIPQLATSQKARTELLDKIEEIQRGKIDYYRKMNEHANKFNSLNTFDFAQPGASSATGTRQNPIKLD
jgi:hypothetical protein